MRCAERHRRTQSLLSTLNALERALSDYERGRDGTTFDASSSDGAVSVRVNGIGRVTAVEIDDSQLTLTPTALASKVLSVANSAIDAAYAATRATIAAFAGGLALPGLPAYGAVAPDYLDFVPTSDAVRTGILANNPCEGSTLYTCASGPVTAVVNRRRRVVSLTYPARLPKFASYLAQRTLEALNCAVDKSTDAPDIDPTPGIVDSRNLNDIVVYAKTRPALADRVKIRGQGCSGWGNIANNGTVETNIGQNVELANVLSRAKVVLRENAQVHGAAGRDGTRSCASPPHPVRCRPSASHSPRAP